MVRAEGLAVLWIDDRPDTALFHMLALEGWRITSVETGSAGLERARAARYDLIVVDLHLPDLHGLTVLERIHGAGISTPSLVITGHYLDPETEAHARATGATAFSYKPLWIDEAADLLRAVAGGEQRPPTGPLLAPVAGPPAPDGTARTRDAPGPAAMLSARLLAALDRLAVTAGGVHGEEGRPDALLRVLLSALADPALPLASFRGCADALRTALAAPPGARIGPLTSHARDVVGGAVRTPLAPRDPRVAKALATILERPGWWDEEALAGEVIVSRSRFARLVREDLGIDFRTLRRLVVMKTAIADVLATAEQVAQIAYRLGMHPGTFDKIFAETFGSTPRPLRRLWRRLQR